ncbi:MAG: MFS transporter [Firmicutes bacterium]|nr:MFS transporter [Bacillota bacterium]
MTTKIPANLVYYIYTGATALLFSLMFTVSGIYRIELANLTALQLVLVGTVLEGSCFLFEIPTGVVADVYSRKRSILIGLIIIGGAFILEGSFRFFETIILAQFLWGFGYTFLSGADDAWIADEIKGKNLNEIYLKGAQIAQFCSFIGILLSAMLGYFYINLPMIISGILFIFLSMFLKIFMPERGFKPKKRKGNSYQNMIETFKEGLSFISESKILIVILFISLIYGLYSEGFDRLWEAHFLRDLSFPLILNFKPVIWFGIINSAAMILSIIAVQIIKIRLAKTGNIEKVYLLVIINLLTVVGIISFGMSGNFKFALMTYLVSYILRTTNQPIFRAWINQNLKSSIRATVLSTVGQIDALGQIAGGPIIGIIASRYSISIAIIFAGMVLSPVVILYLIAVKSEKIKETI